MSRPIINVDLDGVIYPFTDVLAASNELHGRFGPRRTDPLTGVTLLPNALPVGFNAALMNTPLGGTYPRPSEWNFWTQWGMTEGEWNMFFRRGVEYGTVWSEGIPYDGVVPFLWQLSDDEYHIRIVTKRLTHQFGHRKAINVTADWLDRYAIPYRSIAFLGDDEDKSSYPAHCLIDDNPEYVYDFVGQVEGSVGVVVHRNWNHHYTFNKLDPDVLIADDWASAYRFIRERIPAYET